MLRLGMILPLLVILTGTSPAVDGEGPLVVAGGGSLPDSILDMTLKMAGGKDAVVVVIPQASNNEGAGEKAAALWKKRGARNVSILDPARPESLEKATLIWIGGGNQSRLMKALKGTGVPELIRKRREQGAVIAGSSAGAAVQSGIMISGDTTPVGKGLALDKRVIFDQHFVARRRFNRLLDVVLKNPTLVGIGIDEGTAVIVKGDTYQVRGKSKVLIVDARKSKKGRNVSLHVLTDGMTFSLK